MFGFNSRMVSRLGTMAVVSSAFISILVPGELDAQTKFDRYRMVLKSGERVDGPSGEIRDGFFVATRDRGESIEVPISDILDLEIKTGSKAGVGFAIGALGGALFMGLAIMEANADPAMEVDKSRAAAVGAVLVLGGGVIGAAIGSRSSTWEEVPLENFESNYTSPCRIRVTYCISF